MQARTDRLLSDICRYALAFIWIYQGVAPKLLGPDAVELEMDLALGISAGQAVVVATVAGLVEVAIGCIVLLVRDRAWPYWLTLALMIGLLGYVGLMTPHLLTGAFNPVSVNVAVGALALVGIVLHRAREPRMGDPDSTPD